MTKAIIDADLAALYDAPTKALNQAVKRNAERGSRRISCSSLPSGRKPTWSQTVTTYGD